MNNLKKRALIIDDEDALRVVIAEVLDMVNIETVSLSSGVEALKFAANSSDPFDIMIIDMYMPDMTGEETYQKLQEFYPGCPVLFISGLDSSKEKERMDKNKLFLKKPFTIIDLQNAIKELIGSI